MVCDERWGEQITTCYTLAIRVPCSLISTGTCVCVCVFYAIFINIIRRLVPENLTLTQLTNWRLNIDWRLTDLGEISTSINELLTINKTGVSFANTINRQCTITEPDKRLVEQSNRKLEERDRPYNIITKHWTPYPQIKYVVLWCPVTVNHHVDT